MQYLSIERAWLVFLLAFHGYVYILTIYDLLCCPWPFRQQDQLALPGQHTFSLLQKAGALAEITIRYCMAVLPVFLQTRRPELALSLGLLEISVFLVVV